MGFVCVNAEIESKWFYNMLAIPFAGLGRCAHVQAGSRLSPARSRCLGWMDGLVFRARVRSFVFAVPVFGPVFGLVFRALVFRAFVFGPVFRARVCRLGGNG